MPINAAYSAGEIPGQPALKPSPLEDAFRVLAGYVGGQVERKKVEDTRQLEQWKTLVTADIMNPSKESIEKTYGVGSYVPREERYKYLQNIYKQQQLQMQSTALSSAMTALGGQSNKMTAESVISSIVGDPINKQKFKDLIKQDRNQAMAGLSMYLPGMHPGQIDALLTQIENS